MHVNWEGKKEVGQYVIQGVNETDAKWLITESKSDYEYEVSYMEEAVLDLCIMRGVNKVELEENTCPVNRYPGQGLLLGTFRSRLV